jgi:two-component system response regulator HydG
METRTRVLIVEDEDGVRETLIANLELDDRFDLVGVANGKEALARVQTERFDVVLSDVKMPGMSGVDLFRNVVHVRPGMPVILMTAFSLEGSVQAAVHEGVFAVLAKPSDIECVAGTLAQAARRPFVLVVDDEMKLAQDMVDSLRFAGVRALAAYDGDGAVHAVAHATVDVCVLDMMMPGVNADEIVQRVRAAHRSVAFIAVLPDGTPPLVMRQASHLEGMLWRPFEVTALTGAIARARSTAWN